MITHPDKMLFPDDGITKGELASYYEAVAPVMVSHLRGRPATLERYPSGIGKKGFWQKNVAKASPEWLKRVEVPKKGGTVRYPLLSDERSLLWAANLNTVTVHVWTSRTPALERPDLCLFDLDPPRDEPEATRAAALALRDLLDELELPSFVKTTGSKGFHVAVPLDGRTDAGEVGRFAHAVAKRVEDDAIVAVGDDQPEEEDREQHRRDEPPGDFAAGLFRRCGGPGLRRHDTSGPGATPPLAPPRKGEGNAAVIVPPGTRRTISGSARRACRPPSSRRAPR